MGEIWFWNFSQLPGFVKPRFMNEDDMRDIPYPATELGIHIAYKGLEAGSVIGGLIVAPLWHLFRKSGDLAKRKLHHRIGICGRRGMLIGVITAPLMEYAMIKARNIDEDGLRDRCYRLRYNKKQLLIDRLVTIMGPLGWLAMRWPGVVYCVNSAVFVGTIYNATLFDYFRDKRLMKDEMEYPDIHWKPKKL